MPLFAFADIIACAGLFVLGGAVYFSVAAINAAVKLIRASRMTAEERRRKRVDALAEVRNALRRDARALNHRADEIDLTIKKEEGTMPG